MPDKIVVRGARVHNLKNLHLEIPRDRFVVVTGVSGSGKSSLAFDTLYAEGQRRYVESLSAYARQFLQQMEKPDVDAIDGLSPAISIEQKHGAFNPRSTVGTITDIYDYLRLLFARVGQPNCPRCGREISAKAVEQILDQLIALPTDTRIFVLAPIASGHKGDARAVLQELVREGFTRVRIDGQIFDLSEEIQLNKNLSHDIDLVVDRLAVRKGVERRLADSLELASRFGGQMVKVEVLAREGSSESREMIFSQKFACVKCGISLPEITPQLFSFNSPEGACNECAGLGSRPAARRGSRTAKKDEIDARPCRRCGGTRLRTESLAVKLGGKSIAEVSSCSIKEALEFFRQLKLTENERIIGRRAFQEVVGRLEFLTQVGLEYLTLHRASVTLSGGEAQRVRLATQIGSGLAGVLYILDEPSIGLHQRDNARLLALLKQLRDSGNTVIVVEHDPETILAADHVVDMGPGAGLNGGEVVAQGTPAKIMRQEDSLTGQYLSGRKKVPVPAVRRAGSGRILIVKSAQRNNLKNLTVNFPLGAMTCVTGVSGSGKSSLVIDTLLAVLSNYLGRSPQTAAPVARITGWEHLDRVISIDQSPIGRAPRSNPATYTGLYDHIRDLFARLPEARVRGYKAARFSFNAPGGRCEACSGNGVVKIEMYFLPEVYVTCEVCKGRRYNRETLEVKYKGLSIADVLDCTVNQGLEIFGSFPAICDKLATLREVGVGYLRLGQPAPTLSGGEAQRIKLARELAKKSTGRSLYILDEPTTGLHFDDVRKLLDALNRLIDAGNSIVVIEHNLDVIKSADFIVDLGPEGGDGGGEVIAQGTPEEVALVRNSYTGRYLSEALRAAAR